MKKTKKVKEKKLNGYYVYRKGFYSRKYYVEAKSENEAMELCPDDNSYLKEYGDSDEMEVNLAEQGDYYEDEESENYDE